MPQLQGLELAYALTSIAQQCDGDEDLMREALRHLHGGESVQEDAVTSGDMSTIQRQDVGIAPRRRLEEAHSLLEAEGDGDDHEDAAAWARMLAGVLNALALAGHDDPDLADEMSEELEGAGWMLARHPRGLWIATAATEPGDDDGEGHDQFATDGEDDALTESVLVERIIIGTDKLGRKYGYDTDRKVRVSLKGEDNSKETRSKGTAHERLKAAHEAGHRTDRGALLARLAAHRGEDANAYAKGNAARAARALVRHHEGHERAAARIEELAERLEDVLAGLEGGGEEESRAAGLVRAKLRQLHMTLEAMGEGKPATPEPAKEAPKKPSRADREREKLQRMAAAAGARQEAAEKEEAEAPTLTQDEYVRKYGNERERRQYGHEHERLVRDAIANGVDVPDRVLVDYPELHREVQDARMLSQPFGDYLRAKHGDEAAEKVLSSRPTAGGRRRDEATGASLQGFAAQSAQRYYEAVERAVRAGKHVSDETLADVGFTGRDPQGREWRGGELVARGEEASGPDAPAAAAEPAATELPPGYEIRELPAGADDRYGLYRPGGTTPMFTGDSHNQIHAAVSRMEGPNGTTGYAALAASDEHERRKKEREKELRSNRAARAKGEAFTLDDGNTYTRDELKAEQEKFFASGKAPKEGAPMRKVLRVSAAQMGTSGNPYVEGVLERQPDGLYMVRVSKTMATKGISVGDLLPYAPGWKDTSNESAPLRPETPAAPVGKVEGIARRLSTFKRGGAASEREQFEGFAADADSGRLDAAAVNSAPYAVKSAVAEYVGIDGFDDMDDGEQEAAMTAAASRSPHAGDGEARTPLAPHAAEIDDVPPKPGDSFTIPDAAPVMKGEPLEVKKVEGGRVFIGHPDHQTASTSLPAESWRQFKEDLAGKPTLPPSDDPALEAVRKGGAQLLGKGDDGVAFRAGDEVVKLSTTSPLIPTNPGHRTPEQAAQMMREQSAMAEEARKAGVPGLLPTRTLEAGDRVAQVRPYVEVPERLTPEQLRQTEEMLHATHAAGYVMDDLPQVGVRGGKLYFYDTGKMKRLPDDPAQRERAIDHDLARLGTVFRQNGQEYTPPAKVGEAPSDPLSLHKGNLKRRWEAIRDEIAASDPKMSPALAGSLAAARILNAVRRRASEFRADIDRRARAGEPISPREETLYDRITDGKYGFQDELVRLSGYRPSPDLDEHPLANVPLGELGKPAEEAPPSTPDAPASPPPDEAYEAWLKANVKGVGVGGSVTPAQDERARAMFAREKQPPEQRYLTDKALTAREYANRLGTSVARAEEELRRLEGEGKVRREGFGAGGGAAYRWAGEGEQGRPFGPDDAPTSHRQAVKLPGVGRSVDASWREDGKTRVDQQGVAKVVTWTRGGQREGYVEYGGKTHGFVVRGRTPADQAAQPISDDDLAARRREWDASAERTRQAERDAAAEKTAKRSDFETKVGHKVLEPSALARELSRAGVPVYKRTARERVSGVQVSALPGKRTSLMVGWGSHGGEGGHAERADELQGRLESLGYAVDRPFPDRTLLRVRKPLVDAGKNEKTETLVASPGESGKMSSGGGSKAPAEGGKMINLAMQAKIDSDLKVPVPGGPSFSHVAPKQFGMGDDRASIDALADALQKRGYVVTDRVPGGTTAGDGYVQIHAGPTLGGPGSEAHYGEWFNRTVDPEFRGGLTAKDREGLRRDYERQFGVKAPAGGGKMSQSGNAARGSGIRRTQSTPSSDPTELVNPGTWEGLPPHVVDIAKRRGFSPARARSEYEEHPEKFPEPASGAAVKIPLKPSGDVVGMSRDQWPVPAVGTPKEILKKADDVMSGEEYRDFKDVVEEWERLHKRRQAAKDLLDEQDPSGESTGGWTAEIGGEEFGGPEEMNWHRAYDRHEEAKDEQREYEKKTYYPALRKLLVRLSGK